jgi:hypothetical protein
MYTNVYCIYVSAKGLILLLKALLYLMEFKPNFTYMFVYLFIYVSFIGLSALR